MPARTCDGRSVLATLVDVARVGLPVMALVIAGESMGLPLPGETALIAAAILASRGKLDIVPVIALAACAAIVGDNLGYLIGRRGGRRLLLRVPRLRPHAERMLAVGAPLFARPRPQAGVLGRGVARPRSAAPGVGGDQPKRRAARPVLGASRGAGRGG